MLPIDHGAVPSTIEKALALNLDPLKYGTIVEIGAGQEVARWFFQAGAAAGSIAKTMSAYDMDFSDEIYGPAEGRRYVSRARLEAMIEREFALVVDRLEGKRPEGSTFFAFANTVAALGYSKREECHGWLGVRRQAGSGMPPDDIIIHARMLDDTNLEQQEALGVLGVNLIYGAFHYPADPVRLLRSLSDNLKWGRIEVDLIAFRGPTLDAVDDRLMSLELVNASLARAILFDASGNVAIPADALYKRHVLALRGSFRPYAGRERAMLGDARGRFAPAPIDGGRPDVMLAEMTMSERATDRPVDCADYLERVAALNEHGLHVLVSEFFRYFRVRQYLARYGAGEVGIVTDTARLGDVLQERYYDGLAGGILEGLGQLFPQGTTAYVYPSVGSNGDKVTFDTMSVAEPLRPLVAYLRGRGMIVPIEDFDP